MVYQWLTVKLKKAVAVIIPHYQNVDFESFFIPRKINPFTHRRPKVLFLDDLQRYVTFENFDHLLGSFLAREDILIIATCRSGGELQKAEHKLMEKNIELNNHFKLIEIPAISEARAQEIARRLAIPWDATIEFDGNIGSILLKLGEKRRRFKEECSKEERAILRAIKIAYLGGIFRGRLNFPLKWIKIIAREEFALPEKRLDWDEYLERLALLELLTKQEETLLIEETYLETIIDPDKTALSLVEFQKLQEYYPTPAAVTGLGGIGDGISQVTLAWTF